MFKDLFSSNSRFFLYLTFVKFNLSTLPLMNQRSLWGHLLRHLYLKNIYSMNLYINWTVYSSGHRWHDLYKLHLTIFSFYEIFYGVSSNFFLICQINFQTYWDYFFHFILFSSNVILTNDPTGKLFWKNLSVIELSYKVELWVPYPYLIKNADFFQNREVFVSY